MEVLAPEAVGAAVGMGKSPLNPNLLPSLCVSSVLQITVLLSATSEVRIGMTVVMRMVVTIAPYHALSAFHPFC